MAWNADVLPSGKRTIVPDQESAATFPQLEEVRVSIDHSIGGKGFLVRGVFVDGVARTPVRILVQRTQSAAFVSVTSDEAPIWPTEQVTCASLARAVYKSIQYSDWRLLSEEDGPGWPEGQLISMIRTNRDA